MVWHTVPRSVQLLFPKRIWKGNPSGNRVYLTFDDGPVPGVTDYVLNELARRGQKATFFMVGDNIRKHANLAKEVLEAGHGIGNHTYHHRNGWNTPDQEYLDNVLAFLDEIAEAILKSQLLVLKLYLSGKALELAEACGKVEGINVNFFI